MSSYLVKSPVLRKGIALLLLATSARAEDIYVAQTTQGSDTGTSAATAHSVAWLNTYGNWAAGAGKVSAGDTVHLVGTITSPITVQTSGSAGLPITIKFEPGASMTSPAWSASPINIGGNSYITIDGGATGTIGGHEGNPALANGVITATANGTALSNQQDVSAISCQDCTNVTIQGLVFSNLYVRTTGGTDTNGYVTRVYNHCNGGIGSKNIKITNCIFHDMEKGVFFDYGPSASTLEMSYCTAYNVNWGGAAGDHGSSSSLSGLSVHNCYFYNWQPWTSTDTNVRAVFHHNGFYGWAESGGSLTNLSYYNNYCGPGYDSVQSSGGLFVSGNVGNILIYNNFMICGSGSDAAADGLIFVWVHNGTQSGARIYNNTFVGSSNGIGLNVYQGNSTALTTYDVENNIFLNLTTAIEDFLSTSHTLVCNYNLGYGLNAGSAYSTSTTASSSFKTFSSWQSLGFDKNGSNSNPNLDANYHPQASLSTSVIGKGVNFSSYFTSDRLGLARDPSNPWDLGAYTSGVASQTGPTNVLTSILTH